MNPVKTTPMIRQYLSIKKKYPDAILFYRMGDFYEMFFEDAKRASKILDITLTSRNKKDETPIPMCGVPFKAAQGYLAKLIEEGCKVAICDQMEDPAKAKSLVKRDVVRVVTPGMIIEDELLDEKSNNFILSVSRHNNSTGISYLDISTGIFRVSETDDTGAVVDEIERVSPSEIILPESHENDRFFSSIINKLPKNSITYVDNGVFEHDQAHERLIEQFKTVSLKGFGCDNLYAGVCAAGALIYYVVETQKQKIDHLTKIETYSLDNYLSIDDITCRNLELIENLQTGDRNGTLLGIFDHTITSMGARLIKSWIRYPLMDRSEIYLRQEAVAEANDNIYLAKSIRKSLNSVYDLERLGSKISMGHANARDLVALKRSLKALPQIWSYLSEFGASLSKQQKENDFEKLVDLLEKSIREDAPPVINEGGIIKIGYNRELDELIAITQDGKTWIAKLEVQEKEKTGINALKVRYNKVFGYYIEVPKTRSESVPPHYIRKQTLVNAERYITDELKQFEHKVLSAQEKRAALEYEIFNNIRKEIAKHNKEIQETAHFIARLDALLTMAVIADQNGYIKPEINIDGRIIIDDGRHPVVEKMITGERFVPNSVSLDNQDDQILIITGPNMAGKSTVLRQVALIVIMAQIGSFVPATKASVCIIDKIFTRVGALDNLSAGQSTFMVEMHETANILNNATPQSLVILDEIGRGTSTFDGISIAWAVAEYLHDLKDRGVKTLFATHYHELTQLDRTKPRVKNYNIAVNKKGDEIIFLRKLVYGSTNKSFGIQVARLAGIPDRVIKRAKKILSGIEKKQKVKNKTSSVPNLQNIQKKEHKQLSLFHAKEHPVIEKLQKIDVLNMTPIDALNCLNDLKEEATKL